MKYFLLLGIILCSGIIIAQQPQKIESKPAIKSEMSGNIKHPIGNDQTIDINYTINQNVLTKELDVIIYTPHGDPINISVFDQKGRKVSEWVDKNSEAFKTVNLNIASYTPGIYTVVLYHKDIEITKVDINKE